MLRRGVLTISMFVLVGVVGPYLFAQQAPAPGSYLVPDGWRVEKSDEQVILSVTGDKALIYLKNYFDDRESWRVSDEYLSDLMQQNGLKVDVVSKDIVRHGGKDYVRANSTMQRVGRPKYRLSVLVVPFDGGNLLLLCVAKEADWDEYVKYFDAVLESVLPKRLPGPKPPSTPIPVANSTVGLKLMMPPGWQSEPISKGWYSEVPYWKITKDNALLSLSKNNDKRTAAEYVAEVEKNTRAQSKTYTKLSEQAQTIAGIKSTRLELRTSTPAGVSVRRWVIVFSREHVHYVVAAAAPEEEFERYTGDFSDMIASVAFLE